MRDVTVDLFVEDLAQELFLASIVRRVLEERDQYADIRPRSVSGGFGRVKTSLVTFQRALKAGQVGLERPDMIVIGRDGNCRGSNATRREVEGYLDTGIFPRAAIACPDPHIERWYMLDADAFGPDCRVSTAAPSRQVQPQRVQEGLRPRTCRSRVRASLGWLRGRPRHCRAHEPLRRLQD